MNNVKHKKVKSLKYYLKRYKIHFLFISIFIISFCTLIGIQNKCDLHLYSLELNNTLSTYSICMAGFVLTAKTILMTMSNKKAIKKIKKDKSCLIDKLICFFKIGAAE